MSEEEIDLLPYGFLKKYGTFILAIQEYQREVKTDESKARHDRWKEVEHLDELKTNEEK